MQSHNRILEVASKFEVTQKVARFKTALAVGEIGSAVGMIADELRWVVYTDEQTFPFGRYFLFSCLFEAFPSQVSEDTRYRNEEWVALGLGGLRDRHLTKREIEYLHDGVCDSIRAARVVRQELFGDSENFFGPLIGLAHGYNNVGWSKGLARSTNAFLEMMRADPR